MADPSRRARLGRFAREYPPTEALRDAWAEHRWHVAFAAALFAVGIAAGAALALAGFDLLQIIADALGEEPLPDVEEEELTARFFILNNSLPYFMSILGAVSLGVYTAFVMLVNGVIVGNVGVAAASVAGIDYLVVGLAPHGVFELPALFVAAGVGFRLLHRFGQRVLGRRDAFLSKPYLYRTGLLVAVGWLALALAAVIEAYVTTWLLDVLFAERLADLEEAANASAENAIAAVTALLG